MGKGTDKQSIIRRVEKFKKSIEKKFFVDTIIIFGSAARGSMNEHSDVDIIVVSRKYGTKHFFDVLPKLYNEWHLKSKVGYPVDFLIYSRKEFEELKGRVSIVSEAMREGIVVS